MRQLTLIGWYIVAWLLLGSLLMCVGCCPKTYERIVKDTVTVTRYDTVLVNLRPVEISVPVPQVVLTEIVPISDTLLTLDNGLYTSEVLIKDGQVTHTLKPSENADSLHATVVVADTTHITHTNTTQTHTEHEKMTIEKEKSWWEKIKQRVGLLATGAISVVIILLFIIYVVRRRI